MQSPDVPLLFTFRINLYQIRINQNSEKLLQFNAVKMALVTSETIAFNVV